MTEYARICDFENLYKAHLAARRGKRDKAEVIKFEMNLGANLCRLKRSLENGSYKVRGYYSFTIHEPKERVVFAACYRDRVVQHCICDEVLIPILQKKLVYDNAACQPGKGTHFAIYRVTKFLREHYKKHGTQGYILKCDIRKFFQNINHAVLKQKLSKAISDEQVRSLLYGIINSYQMEAGKGIPLGNQASQWFAIYYLDSLDRLIKEKLHIKHFSRYMDDLVLIHPSKEYYI